MQEIIFKLDIANLIQSISNQLFKIKRMLQTLNNKIDAKKAFI